MSDIITVNFTGATALSHSVAPGYAAELIDFRLKLNEVPTTSENFVASINAGAGAVYDSRVYTKDLSELTVGTVIVQGGEDEFVIESDGSFDFAYTNTDTKTYGLQVRYRRKY